MISYPVSPGKDIFFTPDSTYPPIAGQSIRSIRTVVSKTVSRLSLQGFMNDLKKRNGILQRRKRLVVSVFRVQRPKELEWDPSTQNHNSSFQSSGYHQWSKEEE